MPDLFGLFPIPVMRVPGALPRTHVDALAAHFAHQAAVANNSSARLSHTALLKPGDHVLLSEVVRLLAQPLAEFGAVLFGEALGWSPKEMWINVLDTGGQQAMHNHANSFVSGIVYLSEVDTGSRTVFMRAPGGSDFAFRNDHAGVQTSAYNADKWISPMPEPGDALLFPSYLMHAVPANTGAQRISLAFNSIPTHIDSWGYRLGFSG